KAKEQQAAGQSTRVTLAAIRQTAQAVDTIVTYTLSLVSDLITITDPENGDKRRALQKRGWSVGVDVGYGSHSGGRVGVSVGFSF
ncbi:uncharacterized protein LOC101859824, partial [Aplysia californica]|uniref:Uncharacterized protein LOC101859824 n=1 Tax=Aplysia californica TaxID=6500 RepID=A0ABM1W2Q7_APLCA